MEITIDHNSDINKRIDALEAEMLLNLPEVDCQLNHTFTPGIYSRQILMDGGEEGLLVTSKIHKTLHQFIVSLGCAYVKVNEEEWELIEAGYQGVTYPGTRRVLYIPAGVQCLWTTFHPTDIEPEAYTEEAVLKAVEQVEDLIIEKHENILLSHKQKEAVCHG